MNGLYRLSPAARRDLRAIWRYTHKHWGPAQAERYLTRLNADMAALAAGKRVGQSLDLVRKEYLKSRSGSHVIIYRLDGNQRLAVIRVLHQQMDITIHL